MLDAYVKLSINNLYLSFQVYDAARRAAIHDTISNFPDKYSTVVGARGLKVSMLVLTLICFKLISICLVITMEW